MLCQFGTGYIRLGQVRISLVRLVKFKRGYDRLCQVRSRYANLVQVISR